MKAELFQDQRQHLVVNNMFRQAIQRFRYLSASCFSAVEKVCLLGERPLSCKPVLGALQTPFSALAKVPAVVSSGFFLKELFGNTDKMTANGDDETYVIRVRGLPWSATVEEIVKFFEDCHVQKSGVHMTMSREGRPSGEAYIEMDTDEDLDNAVKKHNEHMGHRYIEVFKAKRSEMEWVVKRSGLNLQNAMDDGCVRLRGLPFGCSKEEIAQFFSGLEIVPNGISLPTDYQGRSTGEAYIQFVNKDTAEKALEKHKEKIGHRYIEIFRSSLSEVRAAMGPKMRPPMGFGARPGPYDRGDRFGMNRYGMGRGSRSFKGFGDYDDGWSYNDSWGGGPRGGRMGGAGSMKGGFGAGRGGGWNNTTGHCVHMRGLPFRATEGDIAEFFTPLDPVNIRLLFDDNGRPSGEADVEFGTHDQAVKAMSKDKANMQHRYIELFLNSTPGGNIGGGMGSGSSSSFGGMGGGYGGDYDRTPSGSMGGGMGVGSSGSSGFGGLSSSGNSSGGMGSSSSSSFGGMGSGFGGGMGGTGPNSGPGSYGSGGNYRSGMGGSSMGGFGSQMGGSNYNSFS